MGQAAALLTQVNGLETNVKNMCSLPHNPPPPWSKSLFIITTKTDQGFL